MTNNFSIQNSNNIFSLFPQYDLGQAKNVKSYSSTPKTDTVEINENASKKKKILFGSTIASSILTAGVLGMLFAKGYHGSSIKLLSNELSKEIITAGTSSTRKAIYYAKKGTDKTMDTLQATSNFAAIKDTLFDKLFSLTKPTQKYADFSRKFFKNIVDSTLGKKYDKVGNKINDLTTLLREYNIKNLKELNNSELEKEITIKGTTKTLREWGNLLEECTSKLENSFNEGFSLGARKSRSVERDILLEGTQQKISDIFLKDNGWKNIANYKTYVTEEVTRDAQQKLKCDIINARKKVTNNIEVIYDGIKNELIDLQHSINPKDEINAKLLNIAKKKLVEFKKCSGEFELQDREKIAQSINKMLNNFSARLPKTGLYSEKEIEQLNEAAANIKEAVISTGKNSKGALENIMTIIKGLNSNNKKVISDTDFEQFKKLSKNISTNLKEATEKETGEYFLKQAEIQVGSAATDVFSVFFPFGVGAYAISKCDTKDEKISAALKTCIPLVGTFATFVYGTTKMLSGAKNMIFSTVSGLALNKFGSYLNDLYTNYQKSGSVVQVAKGEYQNVWTDLAVGLDGKQENK